VAIQRDEFTTLDFLYRYPELSPRIKQLERELLCLMTKKRNFEINLPRNLQLFKDENL